VNNNILIEKRTLFVGENIKGENKSNEQLTLRLYVIVISDLPFFKKTSYTPNYKTVFSSLVERRLYKGEFEIEYPKNFPPTISSKHFKTRCSLLIGRLRFGGRILYPRKDLRLKVLPSYTIEQGNLGDLQTNKITFEPGEEIEVMFPEEKREEISIGVSINEWYKEGEEELNDEYLLSEGVYNEDLRKWIIKLPPDPTSIKDFFLFYPFSFEFASDKIHFGIKAYVLLEKKDEVIRKEISIVPKKPMFIQEKK
jgi:hypothetical protein